MFCSLAPSKLQLDSQAHPGYTLRRKFAGWGGGICRVGEEGGGQAIKCLFDCAATHSVQGYTIACHAQQPVKDGAAIIAEPAVHILIGHPLPDVADAGCCLAAQVKVNEPAHSKAMSCVANSMARYFAACTSGCLALLFHAGRLALGSYTKAQPDHWQMRGDRQGNMVSAHIQHHCMSRQSWQTQHATIRQHHGQVAYHM